ncbi:hypothetical protein EJ110_NYTH08674 [Nymphaea thermarum]|nr:hypothetical protein EJ110_NYTH08674 [Nymphaea thermarum]
MGRSGLKVLSVPGHSSVVDSFSLIGTCSLDHLDPVGALQFAAEADLDNLDLELHLLAKSKPNPSASRRDNRRPRLGSALATSQDGGCDSRSLLMEALRALQDVQAMLSFMGGRGISSGDAYSDRFLASFLLFMVS